MAKFEITMRKNGEFQFNLKASNGEVILTSEGYTTKSACLNGVESVKKNAVEEKRYEKLVAKNGKPYFTLKATNGQIIGQSQMYASERNRNNGINAVMKNALSLWSWNSEKPAEDDKSRPIAGSAFLR